MKPSEVFDKLIVAIRARLAVFIWGAPGVGKSAVVRQVAEHLELELRDERVSDRDPVDFRGLPQVVNGRTIWTVPDFWPTEGRGILFLDELSNAVPAVQSVCYPIVLDRKLGQLALPPEWAVVAAGNREADRAISQRMSSALANRFVHLNFDVDLDDWAAWAARSSIRAEVVAFLHLRRDLLHSFKPEKGEKSFPTPRTWEFVSRLLDASGPDPRSAGFDLIAGAVGDGAATEFLGFCKSFQELPDILDIWKDPKNAKLPESASGRFAVACAVAGAVEFKAMPAAMIYINRLPAEFQVLACKQINLRRKGLERCPDYIRWAVANNWVTF